MSPPAPASIDEIIKDRRSVRAFLPDPVPLKTVRHILDVAAHSPSGTNVQPWLVHVVTGAVRDRLVEAVLERREAESGGDGSYEYYPSEWFEPYLSRRRKLGWDMYGLLGIERGDKAAMRAQHSRNLMFFDAPVGLFFSIDGGLKLGSWLDIGMFVQTVMLAARGQGLHTCPQVAWVNYQETVRQIVGMPDDHDLLCAMSMGYEDKSAPINRLRSEREPSENFAKFLGFDEK